MCTFSEGRIFHFLQNKIKRYIDRPLEFVFFEKKKLFFFSCLGTKFESKKQHELEISVMNIEWYGTAVFIGTKKGYYFFDPETGKLSALLPLSDKNVPYLRMTDPDVGCILRSDSNIFDMHFI